MLAACTCTTLNVGDRPTLLELERLKKKDKSSLNLIIRIVPHVDRFGRNLLEDPDGSIVQVIRIDNVHKGEQAIAIAILSRWISRGGDTCTYKHLIECIRDVDTDGVLGALAKDLEDSHIHVLRK